MARWKNIGRSSGRSIYKKKGTRGFYAKVDGRYKKVKFHVLEGY
jgi:hypothetical protein